MTLLGIQFLVQIIQALTYGPNSAGWVAPKIGVGADLNADMHGRPDVSPRGTDPMGTTVDTARMTR